MSKLVGIEVKSNVVGGQIEKLFKSKKSTKLIKIGKLAKPKKLGKIKKFKGPSFLNPDTRLAFTQLRQAFNKALTLHHFDLEYYIQIKTDASRYVIEGVLSQLNINHLTTN